MYSQYHLTDGLAMLIIIIIIIIIIDEEIKVA